MEERHAANAANKATRALEVIEGDLLWLFDDDPDFATETTSLNKWLEFIRWQLFGPGAELNPQLTSALWALIGQFEAINNDRIADGPTTFNTSRAFIRSGLEQRINETRPRPAPTDDPFDVFATNQSGAN